VTRIDASHHDRATAFVSLSGFHRDDFRPLVFRTADFGASWVSIGSTLPAGSINVILEDRKNPALLFAGTDQGVFASLDAGASWARMKNGLPTIAVHDLVIHPRENDLVVGTHGRGVFIADVSPLQQLDARVRRRRALLFEVEPRVQWVMTRQPAVSAQNFAGGNEPFGVRIYYHLSSGVDEAVRLRFWDGDQLIHEAVGAAEPGLHWVDWGMTRRQGRTQEDKSAWDRMHEWLAEDVEFFDYYDTVEVPIGTEEEVDRLGRSMRTRVHPPPDSTERDWAYFRVPPGEYRVTLEVGDDVQDQVIRLLEDIWYDG
jgi:hypothetical protein